MHIGGMPCPRADKWDGVQLAAHDMCHCCRLRWLRKGPFHRRRRRPTLTPMGPTRLRLARGDDPGSLPPHGQPCQYARSDMYMSKNAMANQKRVIKKPILHPVSLSATITRHDIGRASPPSSLHRAPRHRGIRGMGWAHLTQSLPRRDAALSPLPKWRRTRASAMSPTVAPCSRSAMTSTSSMATCCKPGHAPALRESKPPHLSYLSCGSWTSSFLTQHNNSHHFLSLCLILQDHVFKMRITSTSCHGHQVSGSACPVGLEGLVRTQRLYQGRMAIS